MSKYVPADTRVVLFDHDDTLVDTIGTKWAQHIFIASTYYKKELSEDEIRLHWGKPLRELVRLLYGTTDVEKALEYALLHHTEFEKTIFKPTITVLKKLKQSGKLLGIITATSRESFEHDLKLHKVPPELLDYTQTSDDTRFHKPDARVFEPTQKWLATKGVKPQEVLYVGDGLHDMKAAIDAGFSFLGVETGLVTAEQFKAAGAKSVSDIGKLL